MITRTLTPTRTSEQDDPLTRRIIACAIEVHRRLGPGLLEKLYQESMAIEMELSGLKVEKNVKVAVEYKGKPIGEYWLSRFWRDGTVRHGFFAANHANSREGFRKFVQIREIRG